MRSFLAYCQTSLRWLKKLSRCVPAQQVVGHDSVHVLEAEDTPQGEDLMEAHRSYEWCP
jgi:hypothetical protein